MASERSLDDFKVGDRVRIKPEWQDEGDDQWERVVIEAPENSPRVLIKTLIPGFEYPPTERIEISKLERVSGDELSVIY
jgi:hypothetical protein